MRKKNFGALLCMTAALAGCGGGGGGDGGAPPVTVTPPTGTPTPTPTPTATCSLRARQDWAAARLQEDYLYPELLATVNPASYTDIQSFIDAMTATARAQGKDKLGFSYITSIREENALISSGSTAGFGVRLQLRDNRLFVSEAFEGAPGFQAGLDRGTEILSIGTSSSNLQTVASILANGGSDALSAALGPNNAGVARTFQIRTAAGAESTVSVTKADFALDPVSDRYGARIIDDGGRRVGYLNLRTFITDTAEADLRQAFANFRTQGVTEVIVDLRYNGGGLVRIAELLSNLLGGQRTSTDVMSRTVFNTRLSSNNSTTFFQPQPQSISATKIAFIGTGSSASASELVMNAFIPYLGTNAALVGSNTFGKPVGQIARDRAECDDRFRIMAFRTVNRDGQGDYFNGLAPFFRATCRASDDITRQLGDANEASTRAALDFLAGRTCTPIAGGITTQSVSTQPEPVRPDQPSAAQREVPGLF